MDNLYGVWGTGSNVWAVGDKGAIQRLTSSTWSAQSSGTSQSLFAITGSGSDLWAVGGTIDSTGLVLHSTDGGVTWALAYSAPHALLGVWASATDVWAVGQNGSVVHFDGNAWSSASLGGLALETVYGVDAAHIWAAGQLGTVWFWNGAAWASTILPVATVLLAIWATDATHVWAVGQDSILFFDGATWAEQAHPVSINATVFNGIAGTNALHLRAAGFQGSASYSLISADGGATWVPSLDLPIVSYALSAVGNRYFAVGQTGAAAWTY